VALERYRRALEHHHDWQLELACPRCRRTGLPRLNGQSDTLAVNWGDNPILFMILSCPECGQDLRDVAGQKLREAFGGLDIPERNRTLRRRFLFVMIGIPLLVAAVMTAGMVLGFWGAEVFLSFLVLALFAAPSLMIASYRIALLRHSCACGLPDYRFHGMLGRSSCYRCASCGRFLKLHE
jgi:uncharacterized protein YbaR (Trm112 family)